MNMKTWVPVVAAILLGAVAAKLARDSMGRSHAAVASQQKMLQVVIAKVSIQPGQELTAEHLGVAPIVGQVVPPNTFTDISAVAGRIATTPIFAGQTIYDAALAPKGAARGLSAIVPPGMRAITIDVNETSSVAGMLAPGCHVDAVSIISNGDTANTTARTIAQNVLVQAVGQHLSSVRPAEEADAKKSPDTYRTVTLVVTPKEAHVLQLASVNTRMTLILRGTGDNQPVDEDSVTIAELLGKNQIVEQLPPLASIPATQPSSELALPTIVPSEERKRVVELIKGSNPPTRVEFKLPAPPVIANTADLIAPAIPESDKPEE